MKFKNLFLVLTSLVISSVLYADEIKLDEKNSKTELNFYTGMFDFSDDGKRAGLLGIQHQNNELSRNTFLGNLSPITGAMITDSNATYFILCLHSCIKISCIRVSYHCPCDR